MDTKAVVDTSPIAILTTDDAGAVLMANASAERLLSTGDSLLGTCISRYLPPIEAALSRMGALRTELECTGQRSDGETFLAHVWLSKYQSAHGTHAAIVVWDGSEELRSQQQAGLDGTLNASRLVLAGMAHEIRNLASAAESAYRRVRSDSGSSSADMELLGSLLGALGKLGSVGLTLQPDHSACDLASALQELKVIIEPMFSEIAAEVTWAGLENLPRVHLDHHALLQVMLNLARNARRAMDGSERRRLRIGIQAEGDRILMEFDDTGGGVHAPDQLFQPFRSHAHSAGLGLYLSREILRHAGGDLRCARASPGACFAIEIPTVLEVAQVGS